MNINDLPKNSYTVINQPKPLNINDLAPNTYQRLATQTVKPDPLASVHIGGQSPIDWSKPPSWLPGSVIGQAIGTGIAKTFHDPSLIAPGPTGSQIAGDIFRSLATVGGLIAAPATVAGAVGVGAAAGAGQLGGSSLVRGNTPQQAVKDAAIGAAVGGATAGLTSLVAKSLARLGDKIQYSIIKPSQADVKDGFNIGTVKKYDLGGPLPQVFSKTESKLDELTRELNTKLAASNNRIDLNQVYEETASQLQGTKKLFSFGATGKQGNALAELKNEIANVGSDLSIPDAQIVKRAAGHYGAWQFGARDPEATAREQVYNVFYTKMKEAIEKASPEGVKQINQQISELIPVMNAVIRRIPIAERNNAISLTDVISLSAASMNPQALGLTAFNLLSKSGTAANILSKTAPAIGAAAPAAALGTTAAGQEFLPKTEPNQSQQLQAPTASPQSSTDYGHVNADGTITVKGPITGQDVTIDPMLGGGSIERAGAKILTKIASKVHPEDAAIMKDLTAAVAKHAGYHPSTKEMIALQRDAVTIWEKYLPDFPLPKTINGIANDFGRLLDYISIK